MDSSDVIATLYPAPAGPHNVALKVINNPENESFYVAPLRPVTTGGLQWSLQRAHMSPPPTPEQDPESGGEPDWFRSPGLCLRFGSARNHRRGFILGRHQQSCDIIISEEIAPLGVSSFHCVIGFDSQDRLTVTDLRDSTTGGDGTAVAYDGQGHLKRRGFTWLLDGCPFTDRTQNPPIIALHDDLQFQVVVSPRSHNYHQNVSLFRLGALINPMGLAVAALNLEPRDTTAFPSGVQTPMTGPIFLEYPLGKGGFASVSRIANVTSGIEYAKKCPAPGENFSTRRWKNEKALLQKISHPNIVELLGSDFSDPKTPTLYLEVVPRGSLSWQHRHVERLSRSECLAVLQQLLSALEYLHAQSPPIIHRDVKPLNVLVQDRSPSSLHVKLADFGHSTGTTLNVTNIGTDPYRPPEGEDNLDKLPNDRKPHGTAMDIWSLGVLFFELLFGLPSQPRRGRWCDAILKKLSKQPASDLVRFLQNHMLVPDPSLRATAAACLDALPSVDYSVAGAIEDELNPPEEYNTVVPRRGHRSAPSSSDVTPDTGRTRRSDAPSRSSRRPSTRSKHSSHRRHSVGTSSSSHHGNTKKTRRESQPLTTVYQDQYPITTEDGRPAGAQYFHENWYQDPMVVGSSVAALGDELPTLFRESSASWVSRNASTAGGHREIQDVDPAYGLPTLLAEEEWYRPASAGAYPGSFYAEDPAGYNGGDGAGTAYDPVATTILAYTGTGMDAFVGWQGSGGHTS